MNQREIVKIQFYVYCPNCNREIKGTSAAQVDYNLKKHLEKCESK